MLDLICVGRCSLDLYAEQLGVPLAQARSLAMYIGGCSANVAVGAARLGLKVAMLTHVGPEETGQFVIETLRREGIDTSRVLVDANARTPLNIASIQPPDRFNVTYYREHAADLRVTVDDLDPEFLGSARAVLVSGGSMSTPRGAEMVRALVRLAKRSIFDVDHRPSFWSEDAQPVLRSVAHEVDLLVGTEEEIALVGEQSKPCVVTKFGAKGAAARDHEDTVFVPSFPVEVVNTLGAGDSFLAGFLWAWLRNEPLSECLRRGNANGAIVVGRHGCAPAMPTLQEVEDFLACR